MMNDKFEYEMSLLVENLDQNIIWSMLNILISEYLHSEFDAFNQLLNLSSENIKLH